MSVDYSAALICRACESPNNLSNLASDTNRCLLRKLRACVDITIEINDALPKYICARCVDSLDAAYRFKIKCEYTDQKLRDIIEEASIVKQSSHAVHEDLAEVSIEPALPSISIVAHETFDEDVYEVESNQAVHEESNLIEVDHTEPLAEDEHYHEDAYKESGEECKQEYNNDDHILMSEELFEDNDDSLANGDHDIKDEISIMYEPSESQQEGTNGGDSHSESFDMECEEQEEIDEIFEEFEEEDYDDDDDGEVVSETFDSSQVIVTTADEEEDGHDGYTSDKPDDPQQQSAGEGNSTKSVFDGRKKLFECETCHESFGSAAAKKKHKLIHGKQRFQCDICQRWFFKRYHLKNHQNVHNGLKLFECSQCPKSYTNQGNLDRHVRVFHNQQKGHVCDICGKSFSQSTILRQHYAVHMEDRNFECDICHKTYKTQDYLNLHKNRHLPVELRSVRLAKPKKPVKKKICFCTFCGKKTSSLALHQSHMRTHTGEKPYECQVCNKRFSFQQSLRCHALLHTGEKPHECTDCGMTFRQIGHLKGHQLTHTGQKEHTCSVCLKSFAQRGNLTVHMRMHTGETPFHCKYCPRRFYDSNGLKRHTQVHLRKWDPLLKKEGVDGESAEKEEIETLDEEFAKSMTGENELDDSELVDMYISEDGGC